MPRGLWMHVVMFVAAVVAGVVLSGCEHLVGYVRVALDRRRCRRTLLRLGHCEHCGYDLTGNVSGMCPECGQSVM